MQEYVSIRVLILHITPNIGRFVINVIYYTFKEKYSTLSNKRAGWNKVCRLENSAKFGNLKNLKLNWMGLKYF